MPQTFEQAVVLFAFYAFCGWLVEVIYRSLSARRWVNPGLLHGPFVPLYAVGAATLTVLRAPLAGWPVALQIVAFGVLLTALEFFVGWLLEKWLRVQLWNYEDRRFQWRGRICLSFSLAWTALAVVFSWGIHPAALRASGLIDLQILRLLAMIFTAYVVLDTIAAVAEIRAFRTFLARLQTEFASRRDFELERSLRQLNRLLEAFPDLNLQVFSAMKRNLQEAVASQILQNYRKFLTGLEKRRPQEEEFDAIVRDILDHPEFLRLRDFPHHHRSSIYQHACAVSYLSYAICKKLGFDYRSAARGGLLHDFFLYDWRNHDVPDLPREKFHGLAHPRIALENARKHFEINDIERDCILRHMWPLTLVPPTTKESFVVSCVDKYVASREFLDRRKPRPDDGADL